MKMAIRWRFLLIPVSINVGDDIPAIISTAEVVLDVDEDALSAGNLADTDGGPAPTLTDSVDLSTVVNIGADQPGSFQFASDATDTLDGLGLTSGGEAVTFAVVGDDLVGTAGGATIITLSITGTSLAVELEGQLDHPEGDDIETNLNIDLGAVVEAVDEDGDTLALPVDTVSINVGDDIPAIISTAEVVLDVDEDALSAGNLADTDGGPAPTLTDSVDLSTVVNIGADQPGSFQFASDATDTLDGLGLTSGGEAVTFAVVGDDLVGTAGGATIITLSITGTSLAVELEGQLDHPEGDDIETNLNIDLGAVVEAVDEDGDTLALPVDTFRSMLGMIFRRLFQRQRLYLMLMRMRFLLAILRIRMAVLRRL